MRPDEASGTKEGVRPFEPGNSVSFARRPVEKEPPAEIGLGITEESHFPVEHPDHFVVSKKDEVSSCRSSGSVPSPGTPRKERPWAFQSLGGRAPDDQALDTLHSALARRDIDEKRVVGETGARPAERRETKILAATSLGLHPPCEPFASLVEISLPR